MATTTRDIQDDAVALWRLEARSFLDYVVTVATPVSTDEVGERVSAAFQEFLDEELPLLRRLFELLVRLDMSPDRPSHALYAAQYNFVRPEKLGTVFVQMADQEIVAMRSIAERYEDVQVLEERLLKSILADWINFREASVTQIEKILADADRARAAAAGEEVEEVEEEADSGDDEFPWHDEALGLEERVKLAEGKGIFEKLFAAMAQTDCTACGYDCEGYARAIAEGEDSDLSKCAPGEIETEEELQKLMGKK